MNVSVPRDQWSPEMHDLLDPCPRCGSDMGDDPHDDLDVWVCPDCCSCRFSEALPASDAAAGPVPPPASSAQDSAAPAAAPLANRNATAAGISGSVA